MVMVVVAGVLENNDRYRVRPDIKVNSRLFLFIFLLKYTGHPFDSFFKIFIQMLLMGYELILFYFQFFSRCPECHDSFRYINLTFLLHILM